MIRAVVFDIGGVLERMDQPTCWTEPWRVRLGWSQDAWEQALALVDPHGAIVLGGLTEEQYRRRYAETLRLDAAAIELFMADMWRWYCGTPDLALLRFARSLRPRLQCAILSNSADGARREEELRYGFAADFDPIVYSHEVGLAKPDPQIYALICSSLGCLPEEVAFLDDTAFCVEAAVRFGMRAILHTSTSQSIRDLSLLLRETGTSRGS